MWPFSLFPDGSVFELSFSSVKLLDVQLAEPGKSKLTENGGKLNTWSVWIVLVAQEMSIVETYILVGVIAPTVPGQAGRFWVWLQSLDGWCESNPTSSVWIHQERWDQGGRALRTSCRTQDIKHNLSYINARLVKTERLVPFVSLRCTELLRQPVKSQQNTVYLAVSRSCILIFEQSKEKKIKSYVR